MPFDERENAMRAVGDLQGKIIVDVTNAMNEEMSDLRDIGFDAIDAGPLKQARYLETLGILNINLAHKVGVGPAIGFRLAHERDAGAKTKTAETLKKRGA